MTAESTTEAARARAELAAALDELEAKLNVPKRVRERLARLKEDSPVRAAGAVGAVALGVGTLVWFLARRARR